MHLAGEVDDGVDVQDGADLGLLQDAGGDDGDKHLLADRTAVPGKHVGRRRLGRQIDPRQRLPCGRRRPEGPR